MLLWTQNLGWTYEEPTSGGVAVAGEAIDNIIDPHNKSVGATIGGLATVSLIERTDAWKCEDEAFYVETERVEPLSHIRRYDFTGKKPGALLAPITICNQHLTPIYKTLERLKREKFNG